MTSIAIPNKMTKHQLHAMLFADGCQLFSIGRTTGFVEAIEREDGSGHCFNVRMSTPKGEKISIFVRTID